MKKHYNSRQATELAVRNNLSKEVQNYISNTDPLEIRERVNGVIEVDEQEFENWKEVERYFSNLIKEMEELENDEN